MPTCRRSTKRRLARMTGVVPVTTLPADASTYGPRVLYYKYPVVASLPATVVNDARYVLDATKVEYLGVGGSWVAQSAPSLTLWLWKGLLRNAGSDWVDCGRPTWLNQLRPSIDEFTIRAIAKNADLSNFYGIVGMGDPRQIALGTKANGEVNAYVGDVGNGASPKLAENFFNELILSAQSSSFTTFANKLKGMDDVCGAITTSNNLFLSTLNAGLSDNFEGDLAMVEFYAGASADGSLDGLTLIDRYDFDKWDGTANGTSEKGFPFTVTDGTPFTAKSFAWVPT
jgi:hypothetical protein